MNYKSVTQLKMILGIGLLGVLTMLKPTPCRAQAEVDPDHYDTVENEPVPQGKPTIAVSQKAGNFRGTFALPFDVDYAGLTLSPGSYSLSVRSVGKKRIVTLAPGGNRIKIQAIQVRVRTGSNVGGASALVLERARQRLTLTAIRMREGGITLDLQDDKAPNISTVTEYVPICFKGRDRRKS